MKTIISFQAVDARDSSQFLPLTSRPGRHRTKPMTSAALISVSGLSKTYVDGWFRRRRLEVLKGLTLEVGKGEIFGLLGPNGAGKTTFIKILLGIVRKTSGTATLIGHPAGSRRSRRLVGYLPENLRIARHHTAISALNYYGQLNGLSVKQVAARRDELLQTVGLADRAHDSVAKYSKGMLQRLGLAQTLLHDPQLVILDEPTDGLDPVGRSHVRNVLQKLKQEGRTVFLNSHILQEVELICDRVAILDRGILRYVGPVQDITMAANATGEIELDLELAGPEATVRSVLTHRRLDTFEPVAGASTPTFRVMVRTNDQADIDQVVDALRVAGVSVVSLARRKISLEQAFLALIEGIEAPVDAEPVIEAALVPETAAARREAGLHSS